MKRSTLSLLKLSSPSRFNHYRSGLFVFILFCFTACATPYAPYQRLSDEQLAALISPPYSRAQVQQAQIVFKQRQNARLQQSKVEQELKYLACLMVKQSLDPTSTDGKQAPERIPCLSQPKRSCNHECKRSRLPRDLVLPVEYNQVAQRHDQVLWEDLEIISKSGGQTKWANYLKRCLICKHSAQVKRLICLRDVKSIKLTAKRIQHSDLDSWLNQCENSIDPEVQALIAYRKYMLTPPEDIEYPLVVQNLSDLLQVDLSTRASIGEAIRLLRGPLDAKAIRTLLNAKSTMGIQDPKWPKLSKNLKRRLDAPLMPCLEHGIDTCFTTDQIQQSRAESRRYISECKLCEYQSEVNHFRAYMALDLEPTWSSHQGVKSQAHLSLSPPRLTIKEDDELSHLSLIRQDDRLKWRKDFNLNTNQVLSLEHTPTKKLMSKQASLRGQVIVNTPQALYGIDMSSGITRWTHRHAFNKKGQFRSCQKTQILPAHTLSSLNDDGIICWRQKEISILNHFGETTLKLSCPQANCNEFLGVFNHPPKPLPDNKQVNTQSTLTEFLLFGHHQKNTKQQLLHVYPLQTQPESDQKLIIDSINIDFLQGTWLSAQFITAQSQSETLNKTDSDHAKSSPKLLLVESLPKRKLKLHLIKLNSGQRLWSQVLTGRRLLQKPSVKWSDSDQKSTIAVLTDRGFYGFDLTTGSKLLSESIRLKKSSQEALAKAIEKPVSWASVGARVILLHTLNNALYYSQPKPQLKAQSLSFVNLDPQSYLSSIDHQWLVISPNTGRVIGLPPQLDQVVWEWNLQPFKSLILSQDWALVSQEQSAQLFKVFALSSAENTQKKQNKIKQVSSASSSSSACSRGDRWDCLIQGDALIAIANELSLKDRNIAIQTWFKSLKQQPPSAVINLGKVDALVAQGAWSSACQWGLAYACTRLALLAELGFYSSVVDETTQTVVDYPSAYRYYQKGSALGDLFATERSGALLELGQGVTQNYEKARDSYFKACEAGYAYSCARWGFLNELGLGGTKKKAVAISAYQKACHHGSKWACERVKGLLSLQ